MSQLIKVHVEWLLDECTTYVYDVCLQVIVLDNDMTFTADIGKLWHLFRLFADIQVSVSGALLTGDKIIMFTKHGSKHV